MAGKKVYDVRIVGNEAQGKLSLVGVVSIIFMTLFIYLFLNGKHLYSAIQENDFWDIFTETFKELLYSTGFSFVVYFVTNTFSVAKKQKK